MLKSEFASGLLKETNDSLATQIAMWDDMYFRNVIWQKLKGKVKGYDTMRFQIANHTEWLSDLSSDELRLMKLFRLAKHLKVQLLERVNVGDIDDAGRQIEMKSVSLLKQTDKGFEGNDTRDMARYILEKMFNDLSARFHDHDEVTQSNIVKSIIESLESMPEEQREKLKKELKVDELTDAAVRKAIIAGSLGTAFVAVIEVAGFSAYIFAVKALAGIAGILGITLPFAAYTTLTSTIAVLSNPLLLVPAWLGLGLWLNKRANRKIKNGLAPVMVTQAIVSSALDSSLDTGIKSLLDRYEKVTEDYKKAVIDDQIELEYKFPGIDKIVQVRGGYDE